jgi:hypothetical protein
MNTGIRDSGLFIWDSWQAFGHCPRRGRVSFGWFVEVGRAHFLVMLGWKVFGEVVG